MPSSSTRPPGWYRDPDSPASVRYWSGQGWSNRRRARPSWDLPGSDWIAPPLPGDTGGPVLEGPARTPWRPSVAAAAGGRPATRPVTNALRRVPGTAGSGATSGRGSPPAVSIVRAPPWNTRRPVLAIVAITLVAVLALAASVTLTRPVQVLPWSATDPQFVTDSNTLCAQVLTTSRPASTAAMTASTPKVSTAALTRWATAVNTLAVQIRSLPSVPDDVGRLNIWLDSWNAYSADEAGYASWLQAHPGHLSPAQAQVASSDTAKVSADADQADSLAVSNGLDECVLAPGATGITN